MLSESRLPMTRSERPWTTLPARVEVMPTSVFSSIFFCMLLLLLFLGPCRTGSVDGPLGMCVDYVLL